MAENEYKWYVLRAASGKEMKVKEYAEAEIRTSDLGQTVAQVVVPTEKVLKVASNGKRTSKERTFFPGYVLVEANMTRETMGRLRNIPNVMGFLGEAPGAQPMPLRPSEVTRILGTMDEQVAGEDVVAVLFNVGENVKVVSGPFAGFSAVVEEVLANHKLKVMVKILGRKTPLELSTSQVEKE